jgi:hypothetical protein
MNGTYAERKRIFNVTECGKPLKRGLTWIDTFNWQVHKEFDQTPQNPGTAMRKLPKVRDILPG